MENSIIFRVADILGISAPEQKLLIVNAAHERLYQAYWVFPDKDEPFAYSTPNQSTILAFIESRDKLIKWMEQGNLGHIPRNTKKHYRWFFQYAIMRHFMKINPSQVCIQDKFELAYIERFHSLPPHLTIQVIEDKIRMFLSVLGNHFSVYEEDVIQEPMKSQKKSKLLLRQLYSRAILTIYSSHNLYNNHRISNNSKFLSIPQTSSRQ